MAFWDPHRSPAPAGPDGERRRKGAPRSFRRPWAETEQSGLCADEGGGSDVLKLDNALAAVDDFVSQKLGV